MVSEMMNVPFYAPGGVPRLPEVLGHGAHAAAVLVLLTCREHGQGTRGGLRRKWKPPAARGSGRRFGCAAPGNSQLTQTEKALRRASRNRGREPAAGIPFRHATPFGPGCACDVRGSSFRATWGAATRS